MDFYRTKFYDPWKTTLHPGVSIKNLNPPKTDPNQTPKNLLCNIFGDWWRSNYTRLQSRSAITWTQKIRYVSADEIELIRTVCGFHFT